MNLDSEIADLRAELYAKPTIPCELASRKVYERECSSQVLAADQAQLTVCLACPQGHALALSSPWPARNLLPLSAPAVDPAPAGDHVPDVRKMVAKLIEALPPQRPAKPLPVQATAPAGDHIADVNKMVAQPKPVRAKRQAKPCAPKPEQAPLPIEAGPVPKCRVCGWLKPKTGGNSGAWPKPDLCNACAPARPVRPKRLAKPRAPKPEPAVCEISQVEAAPVKPQLDRRLAELAHVLRTLTTDGRMRVSMLDVMRQLSASNYDEAEALVIQAGLRTSRLYGPVQAIVVDHNLRQLLERAAESEVRQ